MTFNINLYCIGGGGYKFKALTAGFLFGNGIRNGGERKKEKSMYLWNYSSWHCKLKTFEMKYILNTVAIPNPSEI